MVKIERVKTDKTKAAIVALEEAKQQEKTCNIPEVNREYYIMELFQ